MQQRDQSRTAFVNEAKFLFDPGTDLAGRARQRRADEYFQCLFLRGAQKARASAHVKTGQALDPTLFKQFEPAADRVVVQQQRSSDFLTTPTVVQKYQGVCASRHTRGHRPIARQRDQLVAILFAEETTSNHSTSESTKLENSRTSSNAKSRHLGRSHSIFWVFSSSGGMVKVARASRKTGQEGK